MKCRKCGGKTHVYDTEPFRHHTVRYRICTNKACNWRVKTIERIVEKKTLLLIVKPEIKAGF